MARISVSINSRLSYKLVQILTGIEKLLYCEPFAKLPTDKCCAAPLALMKPFFDGET
jgi:hypothetical protein